MPNQSDLMAKYAIGRILGEIFRLEKRIDPQMVQCSDDGIYGLINGFEDVIDQFFPPNMDDLRDRIVTKEDFKKICDILDEFWQNPDNFKGCYDIEGKLGGRCDRAKLRKIITYLNLNGAYADLIPKMDSSGSPTELRTFEVSKDEL